MVAETEGFRGRGQPRLAVIFGNISWYRQTAQDMPISRMPSTGSRPARTRLPMRSRRAGDRKAGGAPLDEDAADALAAGPSVDPGEDDKHLRLAGPADQLPVLTG
jgi:hypothetical protein